ncbi:MAG: ECF-type sigma factor [Candidatus Omnitrophica bacterium]|nr:ECF-type sigma factor [Candidatus Omnitrophota bacterium]
MKNPSPKEPSEIPILTIIQQIRDKQLDPKLLSTEECVQCTEALMFEGYSEAQIAQVLGCSQRTIKRYLEKIRGRNALKPNMDFAMKMIGHMSLSAEISRAYLMRLARRQDGSAQEKLQAEFMAWTVMKQKIELLQSLGYLPTQPKQVIGDFFHHGGDEQLSAEELKQKIELTEAVASQCGEIPEELKEKLAGLKNDAEKLRIEQDLKIVDEKIKKVNGHETNAAEENQPSEP